MNTTNRKPATDYKMEWTKITGPRPTGHTVYWITYLPDGRRATVGRIYNEDGSYTPGGKWRWSIWNRNIEKRSQATRDCEGVVDTVAQGKAAVRNAAP